MSFYVQPESCQWPKMFVSLRGTGTEAQFRAYVQKYLDDNAHLDARFAHRGTWDDVLRLKGGEFIAIIQTSAQKE